MMFVIAEREEVNPIPGELEIPKDHPHPIELQSPSEFPSPSKYLTPKDHGTPRYYDDITPSPRVYLTPQSSHTPNISQQFDDAIPGGPDKIEVDDDDDDDDSENDEISGEDDDENENENDDENDEIGVGDADADLVDSLLQEEEDHEVDDLQVSRKRHNLDNKHEAFMMEMKMRKKRALLELRCKVEDAILGNYLLGSPSKSDDPIQVAMEKEKLREITIWGIPLLPSKSHSGSDTVLLKFLRAREFKADEAYEMLQKTVIWRKELNVEGIMEEKLESEDLLQVAYVNSVDKKGHPLCYNLFGPFKDREMYKILFGTEEKREMYLRWRLQCMEKAIRNLSFKPGNVDSIVLITDLGNSPGPALKDLRALCKNLIALFQDYYPEFVYRNLIINVPFWYYVSHAMHSKFANQGSKKRFIFARPAKATDTLLKYISAENLPTQHGGLQRQDDQEFSSEDKAKLLVVKPNSVGTVEIPASEGGMTEQWDVAVVGWEVSYKEEFIPLDEGSYTVLIQSDKRLTENARNLFHIREPGKIALTFLNLTSKKKKVVYRNKCFPTPTICPTN